MRQRHRRPASCEREVKLHRAMDRYAWVRFTEKLTHGCHKHMAMVSTPVGRWRKCLGRFKMQNTHILWCQNHEHAHSSRSVQGPVQWGDGTLHAWVRFGARTHSVLPQHTANSEHTSGAMEDMSGKVQNANTHSLRRQSHEHAHTAVGQFKG